MGFYHQTNVHIEHDVALFLRLFLLALTFTAQVQGLDCITCSEASSNHECNLMGTVQSCGSPKASCFTEVRTHGGVYSIRKGCMQATSCQVQLKQNNLPVTRPKRFEYESRCNDGFDNSVCHYCCAYDICNLAETPTTNGKNHSCTQFLPLCRATWWLERNGFLPESGVFLGCHCDSLCEVNGDCCHDYREVCVGVLPSELRAQNIYEGATGGEYNKILPRGGGLPLLRCFVCEDAASNEECNRIGRIEECQANQRSCMTETRIRGGEQRISKRCEQSRACASLQRSTPNCGNSNVCFSCCKLNYCNVFERPHERNLSQSCLTSFPGYPQCKRRSLSECEGETQCSGNSCNCDSNCRVFRDCCSDYEELCAAPETSNLRWIFREIEEDTRRTSPIGVAEEPDEEVPRTLFSTFPILEDYPINFETSPSLMLEMIRERHERVAILAEERRSKAEQHDTYTQPTTGQVLNDARSKQKSTLT